MYKMQRIICLDGVDKTGKDTIRRELVKSSNGNYLIIVRSFISQIVYSRIYNRNIDEDWFFAKMKEFQECGMEFIVLTATEEELKKRFEINNELDLDKKDILYHDSVFKGVINKAMYVYNINIKFIDTTNKTINQTVIEIEEINLPTI